MRVLFVLDYYDPHIGGVELIFKRLAEGLFSRGHHVKVITTHPGGAPKNEINQGVDIERVDPISSLDRYFFTFFSVPSVAREAPRYDIVHTTAYNGALAAYSVARLAKRPVVYTAPEVLGKRWFMVEKNAFKALSFYLFERLITRVPYDHFVAISNSTLLDALAIGVDQRKSSYVYCGVDRDFDSGAFQKNVLRRKIGARADDFIYTYFGRPGITKGVDYLLKAAPDIQKVIPNAHLVLILSDEPRTQYLDVCRRVRSIQGRSNIHILPSFAGRQALFESLADSDCIVIPSITEGFGLAAAEACTLGVPVIATRAGALPEVVSGRHILIEPGSSQEICDAVLRISRGDWDQIPPKDFPWESMIDAYEKIYRDLLGKNM